ncbi:MAG TPA: lipopolysaccharide heptosyltransferase I [Burkholderiaceae bacterium]|nr:lipopolysaccharide heptosyltransferase I [Burkholderiaceae bacterium]
MKILIVKLSSLGDVLHTLPVVHDIQSALPNAQIDWVVEKSFAGVVRHCAGVNRVVTCELRRWRKALFAKETRQAWQAFKLDLQQTHYDAVIDLQGLTKSAVIAKFAKLSQTGKRYAMANRSDGSSYEAPSRWLANVAIAVKPHSHAVQRGRDVCAAALGYALTSTLQKSLSFGLAVGVNNAYFAMKNIANIETPFVIFAHGTSRADKLWPLTNWVALGQRLNAQGMAVALAHGSDSEQARSEALAQQLEKATVLPRLGLDDLLNVMRASAGVVGVDSGLSHMAVALDLPHVQIYNFDTAWRTGPLLADAQSAARQVSVYAKPTPALDDVWLAWSQVFGTKK